MSVVRTLLVSPGHDQPRRMTMAALADEVLSDCGLGLVRSYTEMLAGKIARPPAYLGIELTARG
jgi:hypothetical protein